MNITKIIKNRDKRKYRPNKYKDIAGKETFATLLDLSCGDFEGKILHKKAKNLYYCKSVSDLFHNARNVKGHLT